MTPTLAYVLIGLLIASNLFTLFLLMGGRRALARLPTREQYRALHPQSIDHLERLRCHRCSSTSLHVDWKAFEKGINIHSCNHCGTRLFRS